MSIKAKSVGGGWFSLEVCDNDGACGFVVTETCLTDLMDYLLATGTCPPGWTVVRTPADKEPEFTDPPTKTVTAPRTCAGCKWFTKDHDTGFKGLCRRFPKEETKYDHNHCGEWGAK